MKMQQNVNIATPQIYSAAQADKPVTIDKGKPVSTGNLNNNALAIQLKLSVGAVNDPLEHEADTMADKVMRMPETPFIQRCSCGTRDDERVQLKPVVNSITPFIQAKGDGGGTASESVSNKIQSTKGSGNPMARETKSFMESRFGQDFSGVRVHHGDYAAQMSRELNAQAFTTGRDIYFSSGKYAPESSEGKRLLAHELTHVVQQGASGSAIRKKTDPFIQRAPTLQVMDQNFIGPLNTNQRRANISCPIFCNGSSVGTMNAVGLFYHQNRVGTRTSPSANDNGVGTALHFQSNGPQRFCKCDSFKIIQIINTTNPAAHRNGAGYVDNNEQHTPFYGDVYRSGTGEHQIPTGYPDAGETVDTTHSIYDRPARPTAGLHSTIRWQAEACVACVRNTGPDVILGGVTYGFTIPYDINTHTFGTIQGIGPSCLSSASTNFVSTLRSDPTTSDYNFQVDYGLGDYEVNEQMRHMA